MVIFTILYGNYYPPHGEFKLICISLNSMGKIAKGVNKINFTILYGNYYDIIIENFPQKFSPCSNILGYHEIFLKVFRNHPKNLGVLFSFFFKSLNSKKKSTPIFYFCFRSFVVS